MRSGKSRSRGFAVGYEVSVSISPADRRRCDDSNVLMTSFPVPRDVTGPHGGILALVAVVLLQSFQTATGCILLLDGWSPMSVGERATLADIVALGVVRRTFKADRSGDGAATYSAEVLLVDVFKGRQQVDSLPNGLEEHRLSSSSSGAGDNSTSSVTQLQPSNTSGETVYKQFSDSYSYWSTSQMHYFLNRLSA